MILVAFIRLLRPNPFKTTNLSIFKRHLSTSSLCCPKGCSKHVFSFWKKEGENIYYVKKINHHSILTMRIISSVTWEESSVKVRCGWNNAIAKCYNWSIFWAPPEEPSGFFWGRNITPSLTHSFSFMHYTWRNGKY